MQSDPQELSQLRDLSYWIGSNQEMVQGPGGNTSFKNSEFMWVKGSGTKLEDAQTTEIFVRLDLSSGKLNPQDQTLHASIETGLHRISEFAVVAHTHSTAAISAGFRSDLFELVAAFGNTAVIPYRRPGITLVEAIKSRVDTSIHNYAILMNHGLLVWGNTFEEVKQRIIRFENEFKKVVKYSEPDLIEAKRILRPGQLHQYLTPDHAIFLDAENISRIDETNFGPLWMKKMYNQLCIVLASSLNSKSFSWLEENEVIELRNWDAEKMRKGINN